MLGRPRMRKVMADKQKGVTILTGISSNSQKG